MTSSHFHDGTARPEAAYKALPWALLRSPLLPVLAIPPVPDGNEDTRLERLRDALDTLLHDERMMAAVQIASPSLAAKLAHVISGETPNDSKTIAALEAFLRYVRRAATRATPFGAFAGIALVDWSASGSDLQREEGLRLTARADMGWVLGVMGEQVSGEAYAGLIAINSMLIRNGGRIVLPFADTLGGQDDRKVDLRETDAVSAVLDALVRPATVEACIADILRIHPEYPSHAVRQLVLQLRQLGVLAPHPKPPMDGSTLTSWLRANFSSATPGASIRIAELCDLMDTTTSQVVSADKSAADAVAGLRTGMKTAGIADDVELLQVDGMLEMLGTQVTDQIQHDIQDAASTLATLGRQRLRPSLRRLHNTCMERYGVFAEVPLLELLSEETGMGPPEDYAVPPRQAGLGIDDGGPLPMTAWQRASLRLVADAIASGARSIEVDDELLRVISEAETDALPASPLIDLYAQIAAADREQLDAGQYTVVINADGVAPGGRTIGRFLPHLDPTATTAVKHAFTTAYPPETDLVAELRHLPATGRVTNVAMVPSLHEAEILANVAGDQQESIRQITLDQVLVRITSNGFGLRLRGDARRLRVVQTHMLNHTLAPNPLRFAIEVSSADSAQPPHLDLSHLSEFPRVPELRRGRVVLRTERWRLPEESVASDESRFRQWMTRVELPRHITLGDFDQRMLLDTREDEARREILRSIKRSARDGVKYLEDGAHIAESSWLQDPRRQSYAGELVVTLVNAHRLTPSVAGQDTNQFSAFDSQPPHRTLGVREHPIGSLWASVELEAPFDTHERILLEGIANVVKDMRASGLIDRWFYIEYAAPHPHIRLRLRAPHPELAGQLLTTLATLIASKQGAFGGVKDTKYVTYRPEIERYGGVEMIDLAEQVFEASSDFALVALGIVRYGQEDWTVEDMAVLAVNTIVEAWGSDVAQEVILNGAEPADAVRVAFRAKRRMLLDLISTPGSLGLAGVPVELSESLTRLTRRVTEMKERGCSGIQLTTDEGTMLGSVLHMQCNRLMPADLEGERRVMGTWKLARRALVGRIAAVGA